MPQLNNITIQGVKASKAKELKKDTERKVGIMVTDNLVVTTKNYIKKTYQDKGYLNTKVTLDTKPDTTNVNTVNMLIAIDKGSKIKIKDINVIGNGAFSDKKVNDTLKKTKEKMIGRVWKTSKYIEADFEEDLKGLITTYSENGYRDARVLSDSVIYNKDKTISLIVNVNEGEAYTFGDITFIGNTVYTNDQLNRLLRIRKGDTYNGKVLKERVTGDGSPDSEDIATVYQNNGYLFSNINAVEVKTVNDTIDFEIRMREGPQATIKTIRIAGNEKTKDFVIRREIRTIPGDKIRRTLLIRSQREISQLNYFDQEKIKIDPVPNPEDGTVDINYGVEEKSSDQLELSAGWGGYIGLTGTLGITFNNFSSKIFNVASKFFFKD